MIRDRYCHRRTGGAHGLVAKVDGRGRKSDLGALSAHRNRVWAEAGIVGYHERRAAQSKCRGSKGQRHIASLPSAQGRAAGVRGDVVIARICAGFHDAADRQCDPSFIGQHPGLRRTCGVDQLARIRKRGGGKGIHRRTVVGRRRRCRPHAEAPAKVDRSKSTRHRRVGHGREHRSDRRLESSRRLPVGRLTPPYAIAC